MQKDLNYLLKLILHNSVHWIEERCFPLIDSNNRGGFAGIAKKIDINEQNPQILLNENFLENNQMFSLQAFILKLTLDLAVQNCFIEHYQFEVELDKNIPLFLKGNKKKLEELLNRILTKLIDKVNYSTKEIKISIKSSKDKISLRLIFFCRHYNEN